MVVIQNIDATLRQNRSNYHYLCDDGLYVEANKNISQNIKVYRGVSTAM